jgi:signal transduction histidine kinase
LDKGITPQGLALFISKQVAFVAVIILGIVLLAVFFMATELKHSVQSRQRDAQRSFTQALSNDILTGVTLNVFVKCRDFFADPEVASIEVVSKNQKLCSFKKGVGAFSVENVIYFDSQKTQEAAVVAISYFHPITESLFFRLASTAFVTMSLIVGGLLYLNKKIQNSISNPLSSVADFISHFPSKKAQFVASSTDIIEMIQVETGIIKMLGSLAEYEARLQLQARQQAFAETAKQVSHDIRSPLSALEMISGQLDMIPDKQRLVIKSVTQRISQIANGLLRRNSDSHEAAENIGSLVESIITEKRLQFQERSKLLLLLDKPIEEDAFAMISATELKRVLSNVINNAIEATDFKGRVEVSIRTYGRELLITIIDNGKGIPAEVLPRLGERGFSVGKGCVGDSGSGLGLYHAKNAIESAGGKLTIQSKIDMGTQVSIVLPRAQSGGHIGESI